jgi:nucleotide-binding universal stress UspA family protein
MQYQPIEPVVAGVDGTLASVRAVDLAAEEATARVAPLVVVCTVEPGTDPDRLPALRRLLDLVVARAQAEHPGLSVGSDLVYGSPVEALVQRSAGACLLVVGHGEGNDREDSVAAAVAARSVAPVIVYRPLAVPQPDGDRPVLIGVDGPSGAHGPVAFAFEEAALRGTGVVACYLPSGGSAQRLAEALDGLPARYPDVPVRRQVLSGPDVAGLLSAASGAAGLAVIGTDGYRAPGRPGLGPVTRALIDTAGCPVAVVHGS